MNYEIKYLDWLNKAQGDLSDLPDKLIRLIGQYNNTLEEWNKTTEAEQKEYLPILEKTDAYISACIYRRYKDKLQNPVVSKAKLLALKAKAVQLNLNN